MSTGSIANRGRRKEEVGEVISDKMNKTISVQISRLVKHPMYNKFMKGYSVFKAHDENNEAKVGDKVLIYETRPLSKSKRWTLGKIVEKAKVQEGADV
jgi:small subunit ribosomal protein S17